ncbi:MULTISPECIES: class B sortase [Anaerotruncus]|jgi:sortase B|nr:class B sortase [Anaerotruncus massiliensis (ex Togo et al. 2019)]GKH46103.1 hypothetical protein CE91St45_06650 [Oscillospiraceae bacterium]
MKRLHLSNRLIALFLAIAMLLTMAACGERAKPGEDEGPSSSDVSSQPKVPAFINPLEDVDLTPVAEPVAPEGELLEKLNKAYNVNNDVVGWIRVPDTLIDNEVLQYVSTPPQASDNLYYERKDINKNYSFYGCYWADYENKIGNRNELSQNTIIYGHSMSDTIRDDPEQDKFTQLKKYLDIEWAKKHPYIYFSTAEDDMTWKVFAVSYVDTKLSYNLPEYKDQNFNELIAELKDRSQFDIDVDVTPSDKILILSTCTYPTGYTNKAIDEATKFLICARLVRPGEATPDTLEMTVNPDPKKPQYS